MGIFSKPLKTTTTAVLGPEAYSGQRASLKALAGAAQGGALERLRRAGEEYQGPLVAALS
ncbi:hypothetical protein LCGC14_2529310, partial [marine sediment metagenome]